MFASLLLCYQLPQPKPVQLACATAKNNETVDVFHTGSEGIDVVFYQHFETCCPFSPARIPIWDSMVLLVKK